VIYSFFLLLLFFFVQLLLLLLLLLSLSFPFISLFVDYFPISFHLDLIIFSLTFTTFIFYFLFFSLMSSSPPYPLPGLQPTFDIMMVGPLLF
jgi:hypothetical protein